MLRRLVLAVLHKREDNKQAVRQADEEMKEHSDQLLEHGERDDPTGWVLGDDTKAARKNQDAARKRHERRSREIQESNYTPQIDDQAMELESAFERSAHGDQELDQDDGRSL